VAKLDPRTAECIGLYGYGIGAMAAVGGRGFCDGCPVRMECWAKHKERVDAEFPVETAAFIAAMDQRKAAGETDAGARMAADLLQAGTADPWMGQMLLNMIQGKQDHG
jgi:hypothetical protein